MIIPYVVCAMSKVGVCRPERKETGKEVGKDEVMEEANCYLSLLMWWEKLRQSTCSLSASLLARV